MADDVRVVLSGPRGGQEALEAVARYLGFEVITSTASDPSTNDPRARRLDTFHLLTHYSTDLAKVRLVTVGDVMQLTLLEAWRAFVGAGRGAGIADIAEFMVENGLECADGPVNDVAEAHRLRQTNDPRFLPALVSMNKRVRFALANNGVLVQRMLRALTIEELDDLPQITVEQAGTIKRLLASYQA